MVCVFFINGTKPATGKTTTEHALIDGFYNNPKVRSVCHTSVKNANHALLNIDNEEGKFHVVIFYDCKYLSGAELNDIKSLCEEQSMTVVDINFP